MLSYSRADVTLVRYPFTDLVHFKVRPAAVVSASVAVYNDLFVVPLTSRIRGLSEGEVTLADLQSAGLNVPSAVKRGILLVDVDAILKKVGILGQGDWDSLRASLKLWLGL